MKRGKVFQFKMSQWFIFPVKITQQGCWLTAEHETDWPIVFRVYAPNQQREAPETEDHDSSTSLASWPTN